MGNRIGTQAKAETTEPFISKWGRRPNEAWVRRGQIVAISHDGNRVVLGPPLSHYCRLATVIVFDFDGSRWNDVGTFRGKKHEYFGRSIALSGDGRRLAIGSIKSDNCKGSVQVFEYNEKGGWKIVGKRLIGLDPGNFFGLWISLSGNGARIAIGGIANFTEGVDGYGVRIFDSFEDVVTKISQNYVGSADWSPLIMEFLGIGWKQIGQTITANHLDWFDGALSLSSDGNIVAVGSSRGLVSNFKKANSVRVFKYFLREKNNLFGIAYYNRLGFSLTINVHGDVMAIGGGEDECDNYAQLFVYTNRWILDQKPLDKCFFGPSSGERDRVAIGSCHSNGINACFQVFAYDGKDWAPRKKGRPASKECTYSVSLSSDFNRLAVEPLLGKTSYLRRYDFS